MEVTRLEFRPICINDHILKFNNKSLMSNNIYAELEQLGLTAQKRAIHVQFSNTSLNNQVFLQRIDGMHSLNEGAHLQLICLSTNSQIPLKQFIGCQTPSPISNFYQIPSNRVVEIGSQIEI